MPCTMNNRSSPRLNPFFKSSFPRWSYREPNLGPHLTPILQTVGPPGSTYDSTWKARNSILNLLYIFNRSVSSTCYRRLISLFNKYHNLYTRYTYYIQGVLSGNQVRLTHHGSLSRYYPRDSAMTSQTYHHRKGANQQFCQISHVFDPSKYPEEDLVYNADREIIPIAIYCVVDEGQEGQLFWLLSLLTCR